ncbi:MAG TPA: SUMF1/EgtB/PvdO family nonheme iron enzyme [Candidatus Binatia bacterium]|nr:SUMF1/EgtB/PvdO family nonheme iron enzyme [Candidatus Binatia bacterium]
MRKISNGIVVAVAALLLAGESGAAGPPGSLRRCAIDAVMSGPVCMDRFEASVWRVPNPTTTNRALVTKIQQGRATVALLTAGGAKPLGTAGDDYPPCADTGQNCLDDIYAVSLPEQIPSAHITWFQAQEACANAGKRLPTSAEWQIGADGTPDPGPDDGTTTCNTASANVVIPTGARAKCRSGRGAFDMVGNVMEWVADWVPRSTDCVGWGAFSNDFMCLAGASTTSTAPGALVRGGFFFGGPIAGPLMVVGTIDPTRAEEFIGFRCTR